MRKLDLTGTQFGHLTVVQYFGHNKFGQRLWTCRCDCGALCSKYSTAQLTGGKAIDCGCVPRKAKFIDLKDRRFGLLVVQERIKNRRTKITWRCKCDCGNLHEATTNELRRGRVHSCGCSKNSAHLDGSDSPERVQQREAIKNYNLFRKYEITLEDFKKREAAQEGRCLICQQTKELVVDHCHATNTIRGLLCATCNSLLGYAKDDVDLLQNAIAYLLAHPVKPLVAGVGNG